MEQVTSDDLASGAHPVLLWFSAIVTIRSLFHTICFLVSQLLPIPLFALALPCGFVVAANALLGMVGICSLFPLLLLL
jgi:hypothetical protein